MPKVFRIEKNMICKLCKKSIVLIGGRRIRIKRIVDDFSCWIVIR